MKFKVISFENKAAGEIDLDEKVFGLPLRKDLLNRMVNYQLAKRRQGTHKTKTVGEISGTGAKPFKQKGTGRARRGSNRSAQMRGGQTTFGPTPRSHEHDMPKKVRRLALKSALSAKYAEGKLIIVDQAKIGDSKTKPLAKTFMTMGLKSALIVDSNDLDNNFVLATRNIPEIDFLSQKGANVFDILRRDTLVLTREAVQQLQERLR